MRTGRKLGHRDSRLFVSTRPQRSVRYIVKVVAYIVNVS